jgi:hypothetical protein
MGRSLSQSGFMDAGKSLDALRRLGVGAYGESSKVPALKRQLMARAPSCHSCKLFDEQGHVEQRWQNDGDQPETRLRRAAMPMA